MVTDFMMQRLIPSEDDMLLESFSGPVSQVWQKCKKLSMRSIQQCTDQSLLYVMLWRLFHVFAMNTFKRSPLWMCVVFMKCVSPCLYIHEWRINDSMLHAQTKRLARKQNCFSTVWFFFETMVIKQMLSLPMWTLKIHSVKRLLNNSCNMFYNAAELFNQLFIFKFTVFYRYKENSLKL